MKHDIYIHDKKPLAGRVLKEIVIWVAEIALVIFLAYLLVTYGAERTIMLGDSMETTISNGDKLIVNKLIYRISKPKRFDVVVFKLKGKEHGYYNIKRIVGLPGETVEIVDGRVHINGAALLEEFEMEKMVNGGLAEEPVLLEENQYFLLGDNRNNSEDSRFANIENVVIDDMIGKAWIRLKPFGFVSQLRPSAKNEIQKE